MLFRSAALPPAPTGVIRAVMRAPIVFPRDDVERVLCRQWATVLGLSEVGVTESLFALGGSSLAATQVVARVRESFQVDVPVRTVFESPTVEEFARALVARERKPGQLQRIARLIQQVEEMTAEQLRVSASQRPENPVSGMPS